MMTFGTQIELGMNDILSLSINSEELKSHALVKFHNKLCLGMLLVSKFKCPSLEILIDVNIIRFIVH